MKTIVLILFFLAPSLCLAQGQTTNWNLVKAGSFSTSGAVPSLSGAAILGWTNTASFTVVSAARDSNEAIVTASVQWPDAVAGTFTTDVASTACPGAIDAYHVTYASYTVTQTAVTRDANCAVVAQPVPTIN